MESIKDFLSSIGLGKNEVEVYISLVESGASSVLQISKKTKIHRSNIYEALRKLVDEGLVFEINNPTKIFYARSPRGLISYLRQKEAELEAVIESYESRNKSEASSEKIKIAKGHFAMRESILGLIREESSIYAYGIPREASEAIGPVIERFHDDRIRKKIEMYHIYNSNAGDRSHYLNEKKFTESRILPKKYDSIVTTMICNNKVILILWEEEITVVEIVDEHLARPYREYFKVLWRKAKVV